MDDIKKLRKRIEAERKALEKEKAKNRRYAVLRHSSGEGYVVRQVDEDGFIARPYNINDAVKIYKSKKAAEKYANKLTFGAGPAF